MHFIKYSKTMQNRDGSVGGLEEKVIFVNVTNNTKTTFKQ